MKRISVLCLGILLLAGVSPAADKPVLTDEADRMNYSIGYQIGGDFQRQGWKLNADMLIKGLRDAIDRTDPLMTPAEMNSTLANLKKKLLAEQQRAAKEADKAFLAEQASQPGVVVLPSGVRYKVIKEGTGKQPTANDSVTIRYKFGRADQWQAIAANPDSGPKTYPLQKALPGLREALQLMKEGAIWQIVLPPGPALGPQGEALESAGVLVYELALISVQAGQ
jgi:FKBP-type peptidyl-prolyl cis-trans isomerase FklB